MADGESSSSTAPASNTNSNTDDGNTDAAPPAEPATAAPTKTGRKKKKKKRRKRRRNRRQRQHAGRLADGRGKSDNQYPKGYPLVRSMDAVAGAAPPVVLSDRHSRGIWNNEQHLEQSKSSTEGTEAQQPAQQRHGGGPYDMPYEEYQYEYQTKSRRSKPRRRPHPSVRYRTRHDAGHRSPYSFDSDDTPPAEDFIVPISFDAEPERRGDGYGGSHHRHHQREHHHREQHHHREHRAHHHRNQHGGEHRHHHKGHGHHEHHEHHEQFRAPGPDRRGPSRFDRLHQGADRPPSPRSDKNAKPTLALLRHPSFIAHHIGGQLPQFPKRRKGGRGKGMSDIKEENTEGASYSNSDGRSESDDDRRREGYSPSRSQSSAGSMEYSQSQSRGEYDEGSVGGYRPGRSRRSSKGGHKKRQKPFDAVELANLKAKLAHDKYVASAEKCVDSYLSPAVAAVCRWHDRQRERNPLPELQLPRSLKNNRSTTELMELNHQVKSHERYVRGAAPCVVTYLSETQEACRERMRDVREKDPMPGLNLPRTIKRNYSAMVLMEMGHQVGMHDRLVGNARRCVHNRLDKHVAYFAYHRDRARALRYPNQKHSKKRTRMWRQLMKRASSPYHQGHHHGHGGPEMDSREAAMAYGHPSLGPFGAQFPGESYDEEMSMSRDPREMSQEHGAEEPPGEPEWMEPQPRLLCPLYGTSPASLHDLLVKEKQK